MIFNSIIKGIPIPIAGLMLGLAAAGNLVSSYGPSGNILKAVFGILSTLIAVLLLIKTIFFTRFVIEDLENPAIISIAGTFSAGIMVLATYIHPFLPLIAYLIFVAGILLHFVLIIYFTKKFLYNFSIEKVLPSYFVVYVGIAVASIVAPVFNATGFGMISFWFGLITYLLLLPTIIYIIIVIKPLPKPLLPTLTIFAAPPSICLAGYLNSFQDKSLTAVWALTFLSLITLFAVLIYMPRMINPEFYPSYSAFTFPFVISAIAIKGVNGFLIEMQAGVPAIRYLVYFEELLAISFVLYVLIRYIDFLFLYKC